MSRTLAALRRFWAPRPGWGRLGLLLLCGIGLIAKTQFKPSQWCSTNRDIECSIYTIGMIMLAKIRASPSQALAAVLELSEAVGGKWG